LIEDIGNFAFCGLTFDPGYVNLATSKMVFSITPTNSLTSSSTLTILFPRNTWTNDISNQVLPITSTMACNNMTAVFNHLLRMFNQEYNVLVIQHHYRLEFQISLQLLSQQIFNSQSQIFYPLQLDNLVMLFQSLHISTIFKLIHAQSIHLT